MDEYEDNFDELQDPFSHPLQKLQRFMFLHEVETFRTQDIPLSPEEFELYFGELTEFELEALTQCLIKDIHSFTFKKIIKKWGTNWIQVILDFNVNIEEYELCARFKEVMDSVK